MSDFMPADPRQPIPHARAVEMFGAAMQAQHRSNLAAQLWKLRSRGACIRIRRTHCRHTGKGWDFTLQWSCTIGLPDMAVCIERPSKVDAIAQACQVML